MLLASIYEPCFYQHSLDADFVNGFENELRDIKFKLTLIFVKILTVVIHAHYVRFSITLPIDDFLHLCEGFRAATRELARGNHDQSIHFLTTTLAFHDEI